MALLRTPDERFDNLPDYPFAPHFAKIDKIRGVHIHYVDEGDPDAEVILCLHGEPTWSYLYRKMIPPLAAHYHVIAPDFVGFGRSEKFSEVEAYTFDMHRDTLVGFIEELGLMGITLVVHDWGGLIGLTVAAQHPERFSRLVIMNTGLPTGDPPPGKAFLRWREFVRRLGTRLPIARVIRGGLAHPEKVPADVIAAYEAPFPDETYKAGAVAWPLLVPTHPDDPGGAEIRATRQELSHWDKPALILFSNRDPITSGLDALFRELIPAATHHTIHDAGHFLQEEKGEEIAARILEFMKR